jgi:hypothetical protein
MPALDALIILAAVMIFLFTSLFAVGALIGLAGLVKEALMAVRPAPVSRVSVAPAATTPAAARSRAPRPEPEEIPEEFGAAAAQA